MFQNLINRLFYPKFPYFPELSSIDSGVVCLKMVSAFHGKDYSLEFLRENNMDSEGTMNLENIQNVAERIGFQVSHSQVIYVQLTDEVHLPVIIPWKEDEYVVLYRAEKSFWSFLPWVSQEKEIIIADPKSGFIKMDKPTFKESWRKGETRKRSVLWIRPKVEPVSWGTLR